MEWYAYLSPHTFSGVLTFVGIFTFGVIAHIKIYSSKQNSINIDKENHIVQ